MLNIRYFNKSQSDTYQALDTPCLCVDKQTFLKNLMHLRTRTEALGASLRPHFKTVRAAEALKYLLPDSSSPITVSTLKEAEALISEGYTNVIYAVGISAAKLKRIKNLQHKGQTIRVLADTPEQANQVNLFCEEHRCSVPVLLEIDCDGHRGGIRPDDPLLIDIAQLLHTGAADFKGVLTHAGESYHCLNPDALREAAANEVKVALDAAARLRAANIPCEIVSVGSTPTAHHYENLDGITEVRAGVYSFFDLVMKGIGICELNQIAATVATTVIGHNHEKGWLFVDAGWMALSGDRGTAQQPHDCGYGLVADETGQLLEGLQVSSVNQEHGILTMVNDRQLKPDDFPIGSRLHILPNHACATAAMHSKYHVFDTQAETYEVWNRIQGW
ncbi:DSD1 family PLP-dependent enzyme [Aliamphritea hakodatensis]|uniref:DSD1 family PLP-dependent enzyme n=1 Tax=Aliamphritea hakodatensis TaxID=2895352 RepID=UPI0022FD7372|nr:DSD1 family PLP-dependent enzyme [Aliamphritea hakodatensis]